VVEFAHEVFLGCDQLLDDRLELFFGLQDVVFKGLSVGVLIRLHLEPRANVFPFYGQRLVNFVNVVFRPSLPSAFSKVPSAFNFFAA